MVRSFVDRNEGSRARLRRVVEALTDEDGSRPVVEDGRPRLVDRSLHRAEHLDLMDRALERSQPG